MRLDNLRGQRRHVFSSGPSAHPVRNYDNALRGIENQCVLYSGFD
jgi:hypothetical protein